MNRQDLVKGVEKILWQTQEVFTEKIDYKGKACKYCNGLKTWRGEDGKYYECKQCLNR